VLASAGLPGLNGFVGEFMILLGSFKSEVLGAPVLVAFATLGVILAAVYLLHMVYRTFFGALDRQENRTMRDMNVREVALMLPLVVLMLVLGFFPQPFLERTQPATDFLLQTIEEKRASTPGGEAVDLTNVFGGSTAEESGVAEEATRER
jgi:NADH-quinone oxidoreductase subunit M